MKNAHHRLKNDRQTAKTRRKTINNKAQRPAERLQLNMK
jgi:hypothetical protein